MCDIHLILWMQSSVELMHMNLHFGRIFNLVFHQPPPPTPRDLAASLYLPLSLSFFPLPLFLDSLLLSNIITIVENLWLSTMANENNHSHNNKTWFPGIGRLHFVISTKMCHQSAIYAHLYRNNACSGIIRIYSSYLDISYCILQDLAITFAIILKWPRK